MHSFVSNANTLAVTVPFATMTTHCVARAVLSGFSHQRRKERTMESNTKAMRDALEAIISGYEKSDFCYLNYGEWCHDPANFCANVALCKAIHEARAALAEPPRNCDVGTPDEQSERFENFCLKHIGCAEETGGRHCVGCPLEKASRNITQRCELYWAHLPYESEAAK